MRYLISATLLLALTACGGGDESAKPAETVTVIQTPSATPATTTSEPTVVPTSEPAEPPNSPAEKTVTLPQACRAIAQSAYSTFGVPTALQAQTLVDEIDRLLEEGDAETYAAIKPLQESANAALESANNEGDYGDIFAATSDLYDKITVLNEPCDGALDFALE